MTARLAIACVVAFAACAVIVVSIARRGPGTLGGAPSVQPAAQGGGAGRGIARNAAAGESADTPRPDPSEPVEPSRAAPPAGGRPDLTAEEAETLAVAIPPGPELLSFFEGLPPGELRHQVGARIEEMTLADPSPALALYLRSQDPSVQRRLAPVLSRSADASVVSAMVDLYRANEQSPRRFDIDAILSGVSNPGAAESLITQFQAAGSRGDEVALRAALARGLGSIASPEAVEFLFRSARDEPDPRRIELGIESGIGAIQPPRARAKLLEYLKGGGLGESKKVRWLTLAALENDPDPAVVAALRSRAPEEEARLADAMTALAAALESRLPRPDPVSTDD